MVACKLWTVSVSLLKQVIKNLCPHIVYVFFSGTGLPDWGIALIVLFAIFLVALVIIIIVVVVVLLIKTKKGE